MVRRRNRGFTLTEFGGVLTIIAILAAILFPVFAQAREKARAGTCRSNLHQIGMALNMYGRDYDGNLPPRFNDLKPLVVPYVNGLSIFRCPSDSGVSSNNPYTQTNPNQLINPPVNPGLMKLLPGPIPCSYQYRSGLKLSDRGDTAVAADTGFLHNQTALVLDLSGAVRVGMHANWQPLAPQPLNYRSSGNYYRPEMTFLAGPRPPDQPLSSPGDLPGAPGMNGP